jgi:hypothetical protein
MNPKTMMDCGNFTPNWTPETNAQNIRNKLLINFFLLCAETKKELIIMHVRQNVKELYDKIRPCTPDIVSGVKVIKVAYK